MIQFARLTISLPIALEEALREQRQEEYGDDASRSPDGAADGTALLNRRVFTLLRGIVSVLERMEGVVQKQT